MLNKESVVDEVSNMLLGMSSMTAKECDIKAVINHFIVVKQVLRVSNKMKCFDYVSWHIVNLFTKDLIPISNKLFWLESALEYL